MDFNFDIRGYLKPEGKNNCSFSEIQSNLVDPFELESTRYNLFENLIQYNHELQKVLGGKSFTQWINGSFVSTQENPDDIDLVNLIDFQL